jgi:hypothetical protein
MDCHCLVADRLDQITHLSRSAMAQSQIYISINIQYVEPTPVYYEFLLSCVIEGTVACRCTTFTAGHVRRSPDASR